jgi:hypothetical protein
VIDAEVWEGGTMNTTNGNAVKKDDHQDELIEVDLDVVFKGQLTVKLKRSEAEALAKKIDEGDQPDFDSFVEDFDIDQMNSLDGKIYEILSEELPG